MKNKICCLIIVLLISCKQQLKIENIAIYNILLTRNINGGEMRLHLKINSKLSQTELIKITTSRRRSFPADTLHDAKYIFWLASKLPASNQFDPDEDYSYATIFYPHKPLEKSFVSDEDIDGAPCHVSMKSP